MKRSARAAACLLLASLQAACVSLPDRREVKVDERALAREAVERQLKLETVGPLELKTFVYKPAVIPLEDFLKRLARGDLKRALRSLELKYASANTHDEAMRALIAQGYAPAFVEVENRGKEPIELERLRLSLAGPGRELAPIPNERLPREFESFSPKAVAVNTYNTGVVILGATAFIAILAASIVAMSRGDQELRFPYALDELAEELDGEVYNTVRPETVVDYNRLLWTPQRLEPGRKARGLLFFKAADADWRRMSVQARLQ